MKLGALRPEALMLEVLRLEALRLEARMLDVSRLWPMGRMMPLLDAFKEGMC